MEWTLRKATKDEFTRINELFVEMLETIYNKKGFDGYKDGDLNRFFDNRDEWICVAETGDGIIAFLSIEVHHEVEEFIYLDDLSVTEKYRGTGVGTALLNRAKEYAAEIGINELRLHVERENRGAFALYERLGYKIQKEEGTRCLMSMKLKGEKSGGFTMDDMQSALSITGLGIWRLEAEEGKHIRFYGNSLMNELIGVSDFTSPEDRFDFFMSRIYEEDMPSFMSYYTNLRTEQSEITYRYDHPTRGVIYVRCGGKRDDSATGIACYRGFHQDVSKTVRIEEESRKQITESAERYQKMSSKLMENFVTTAMYIDLENKKYRWLTCQDKNLLGIEEYGQIGLAYSSLMPEEYAKQFLKNASFTNLREVFKTANEYNFSIYVYNEQNELRRTTMYYYSVDDSKRYILAVSRDTTEDYRREKELASALLAAESASNAKTTFLNNMSHDIRTPMNAIIGFNNLAKMHIDDPDRCMDYLNKIGVSSEHLLSLINDVLDMSRIESGKMKIINSQVSLSEIMRDLETIFMNGAQEKGINLKIECSDIKNDVVLCDKLRVNQILLNCVSNSIKFTEPGGEVSVLATQLPSDESKYGCYQFTIKDTGIGMSEEFVKTIFEPFTREETGKAHQIQGTGLGMSICKAIVDLMGGSIDVVSKIGEGSCFKITLKMPIVSDSDVIAGDEDDNNQISLEGKHILLVEDNELNREIATEILSTVGAIIDCAENGQIAVDMISKSEIGFYDYVLMDVQMPVLNGYEATRTIRKLDRADAKELIIIAMTANAFEEDRMNAIEAGMNDHVAKPVNIPKVISVLKKYAK